MTSGTQKSVSLNVSYHKEHEYIWFLRHYAFNEVMRGCIPPGDPMSMSLNVSHEKEHQYIWFRGRSFERFVKY